MRHRSSRERRTKSTVGYAYYDYEQFFLFFFSIMCRITRKK